MNMNKLAVMVLAATLSAPVLANKVATVNGEAILQADLDNAAKQLIEGSGGRIKDTPELRNQLKQQLINRTVMLQEANKRGLGKTKEFQERVTLFQKDLLAQSLVDDIARKHPVSDAQVKAEYDKISAKISGQKEVRVREIVLGSEAEAKEVIAQAKKGAKFDVLARNKSKDPAAKQTGGEMGWLNLNAVSPVLAEALRPLNKNQINDTPLPSSLGFHVFKVEDTRLGKMAPFNEVKEQLRSQMQGEQIEKVLFELREKAKIQ